MSNWSGPPLFLIGAARSGTTLLGDILGQHPELAYWVEPKYVWRHGRPGGRDDVRSADEATPGVSRHIRQQFERYSKKAMRDRFLEKTPSNCFRVAFMHRAFPEALFLHVLRDGRDAAASALQRWRSKPDDGALWRRIRQWEVPLTELHHYVPDFLREALLRRLQPARGHVWGPRYPGLLEAAANTSPVELCAHQWVESTRCAMRELAQLPPAQVFSFRYEDFVADPGCWLPRILGFAGLPSSEAVAAAASMTHADSIGAFRRLPEPERKLIEAICLPAMRELGLS